MHFLNLKVLIMCWLIKVTYGRTSFLQLCHVVTSNVHQWKVLFLPFRDLYMLCAFKPFLSKPHDCFKLFTTLLWFSGSVSKWHSTILLSVYCDQQHMLQQHYWILYRRNCCCGDDGEEDIDVKDRLTSCRACSLVHCCSGFCSTARLLRCNLTDGRWRGAPHYSQWPGPGPPTTHWPPRSFQLARTKTSQSGPPETSDTREEQGCSDVSFILPLHIKQSKCRITAALGRFTCNKSFILFTFIWLPPALKSKTLIYQHYSCGSFIEPSQSTMWWGNTLEVMTVSGSNWLTFLRLKALSSSFSTAWIFLTLMVQRASFPGTHKCFSQKSLYFNYQLPL